MPLQLIVYMEEESVESSAHRDDNPSNELRSSGFAVAGLVFCFIFSLLLAMLIAPFFNEAEVQAFDNPEDPTNSFIYLVLIFAFTAMVLWLSRKKLIKILHSIFLLAIATTFIYVVYPLFFYFGYENNIGYAASTLVAILLTSILLYYPEWYIIDISGILLAAGVAAIFGISFGWWPAIILLVCLAIYDAWAVYRSGHMVDLADSVLDLRIPLLLVMPKSRKYSFLEHKNLHEQLEGKKERDAMFMGLGDIIIPGTLVVSSKVSMGWAVGLGALVGSLIGFTVLMIFVLRGKPQAGLPLLNGGAILGFLIMAFATGGLDWNAF